MTTALATGFGFGFVVAAQVGPIWLLCLRSVLRGGVMPGLAIGAGAALVDVGYALLGVVGVAALLDRWEALRTTAGILGVAVLAVLALRALRAALARPEKDGCDRELTSPRAAFLVGLAATAGNPLTILAWAAVFAAASSATPGMGAGAPWTMLAGVGAGTFTWFAVLSLAASALGRFTGPRFHRGVDLAAAVGLLVFAAVLAWRVLAP
ncbi:LysE family transporter [Streptomonospora sp. S1-112]|uniref:LysE family transporter n=1 Tax=Streptomonospora mangrovi TaxID=2883123 RepID=A0A9X3SEZ5_9ACTN|nr:LysE family transporter [Streptomonospora mangrovi]MDA0564240.1 LysE family transporter [Streptomonospora mangrovi]